MDPINRINGKIEKEENRPKVDELISISDACLSILFGETVESKITHYSNVSWERMPANDSLTRLDFSNPGRPKTLMFSDRKIKFPKDHEFNKEIARAKALHFFANHELLAIEVMAKMILLLPNSEQDVSYKMEIWKTLQDEQKHFYLYKTHIENLGHNIGSFPVNDYFWKSFRDVKDFKSYFSLMALTFETANLDFAEFYSKLFAEVGDFRGKFIMDQIYDDEIFHVKLGIKYFSREFSHQGLWKNYVDSLPWPLTPARSKGIQYKRVHRVIAGYPDDFIHEIETFNDHFRVTERKR